jgi:peptidoglycan/xylan/chitin deacetylase (PgdA/CDA1 family)
MSGLRTAVKAAAAEVLYGSGALRLLRPRSPGADDLLVLGYHRVVEDTRADGSIPAMLITPAMLERQLEWTARRYRFVSLDELWERLEGGQPLGEPLAAVTFDDGYADVYHHALPLLRRMGIPAAVFVVSDLMGSSRLQTHDLLYLAIARLLAREDGADRLLWRVSGLGLEPPALDAMARAQSADVVTVLHGLRENLSTAALESLARVLAFDADLDESEFPELLPMTWDMVAGLVRSGITVGSHTASHALLTQEGRERVREELRGSRRALELRLGVPVRHFAYPDGRFDAGMVDEVAAAGYRTAFTTCHHRDERRPLLTVPRRLLWENSCRGPAGAFSPAVMGCLVEGVFGLSGRCRQDHGRPRPVQPRPRLV